MTTSLPRFAWEKPRR